MKAILRFDLPDEQGEFDAAIRGREALSILWDIDNHCRSTLKYGDVGDEAAAVLEEVRRLIPQELLDV